jgi:hypothetical protein
MPHIIGRITTEYFDIFCKHCGEKTENTYLGWDPGVPHFAATCKTCNSTNRWKFSLRYWSGLGVPNQGEKH